MYVWSVPATKVTDHVCSCRKALTWADFKSCERAPEADLRWYSGRYFMRNNPVTPPNIPRIATTTSNSTRVTPPWFRRSVYKSASLFGLRPEINSFGNSGACAPGSSSYCPIFRFFRQKLSIFAFFTLNMFFF